MIQEIIDYQFGPGCGSSFLPQNEMIILNRAPDIDRLDEIIFDGNVQGAIKFDLDRKRFRFLPRISGAKRFLKMVNKGLIQVDEGAIIPVLTGSNVLAPGIVEVSDGISKGDEVLVVDLNFNIIGLGMAHMSSEEMSSSDHGMAVKVRWHEDKKLVEDNKNIMEKNEFIKEENKDIIDEKREIIEEKNDIKGENKILKENDKLLQTSKSIEKLSIDNNKRNGSNRNINGEMKNYPIHKNKGWQLAIKANKPELDRIINESKKFIKSTIAKFNLPVAVSISGGKDSLATLHLVLNSNIKPTLFFIDTGLEFPETVEHIKNVSKSLNLNLLVERPFNTFWSNLTYFGPPGKDYRWCCKTCKLGPATKLIKEHFPGGVLVFIGQRRYESQQRSGKGQVWQNPWVPGQIGASPIQNWSALHIWLYLFNTNSEYNKLYEHGLARIGCWLCPASDIGDFISVCKDHPDHDKWMLNLIEYSKTHQFTPDWVSYGLWRWKKLPKGVEQLMREKGITIKMPSDKKPGLKKEVSKNKEKIGENGLELLKEDQTRGLFLRLAEGYTDCKYGLSQEGVYNKPLDLKNIANILNILGSSEYNKDNGFCTIDDRIDVYSEGGVVVKGKGPKEIKKLVSKVHEIILRAMECIGCGICVGRCENNALTLNNSKKENGRIRIIEKNCIHCGKCLGPCPVVNFNLTTSFEL
jgi:predicted RNA-binding protein (TIGR00451 family)